MSNPDQLPQSLQMFADLAGAEVALRIALERAGTRLFIPKRIAGSKLEALVGSEAAGKLSAALGGEAFEIPLAKQALNSWLRKQGWSQ